MDWTHKVDIYRFHIVGLHNKTQEEKELKWYNYLICSTQFTEEGDRRKLSRNDITGRRPKRISRAATRSRNVTEASLVNFNQAKRLGVQFDTLERTLQLCNTAWYGIARSVKTIGRGDVSLVVL